MVRLFFFIWAYFKLPIAVDESWVGLMSMHILKGEFPVVYWGQSYMGTQEAYFDAPLIWLFGANAVSIRIYPFLWSLLFMFFTYKLACSVYNKKVGIITLLLLALPAPYISIASAVVQPDNYISTITLGTISLLITYELVFGKEMKRRVLGFTILGFVLGFAFWMHILIVSYIGVVLLFLFLKDKMIIIKKEFWMFILAFIIGCLPLLWYNLTHNFATFYDVACRADLPRAIENLKGIFNTTIHFLLGTKVMLCADTGYFMNVPFPLYFLTGIVSIGLILLVIITKFKKMWRICLLSLKKVDGTSLLLVTAVACIYTFARSGRSNPSSVRYLLPIMSVLPILISFGLWEIKRFSKTFFYLLISIILLTHLWGNILLAKALNNPVLVAEELDLQDMKPLINFLKKNNIRYAYANYCIAYNLTYETNEEIICAPPYNERFSRYDVPFIENVRKADNVAYIMHKNLGIKPDEFEDMLKIIGGSYKKEVLDSYTIFYSFKPPYKEKILKEIPRFDWHLTSNFMHDSVNNAIDGKLETRWGSGTPQSPNMHFFIDLGGIYEISKIRFDLGRFITDYPRGYKIEVSLDNTNWETVISIPFNAGGLFWEGTHPRFLVNGDFFTSSFYPVRARYIMITQTGMDSRFDWSIAELRIYG